MTTLRIPLLRDRHTHPLLYAALDEGLNLSAGGGEGNDDADLLRNLAVQRIRDHARKQDTGWAIVYGWNSGRYTLLKQDFDDLPPLVVFNLSLHGLIVNNSGRTLLHQQHPDIVVNLDDQNWIEKNLRRVLNVFASDGATPERLRSFFQRLLEKHGVYHAEEMLLVDENEIRLFVESGLIDRTRFWSAPDQYSLLPPAFQQRVHGIKLFADGALGARTAALHQPYNEADHDGLLMHSLSELAHILRHYFGMGKPIALHAIGDRAIDQAVAAAEAAGVEGQHELWLEQFL